MCSFDQQQASNMYSYMENQVHRRPITLKERKNEIGRH